MLKWEKPVGCEVFGAEQVLCNHLSDHLSTNRSAAWFRSTLSLFTVPARDLSHRRPAQGSEWLAIDVPQRSIASSFTNHRNRGFTVYPRIIGDFAEIVLEFNEKFSLEILVERRVRDRYLLQAFLLFCKNFQRLSDQDHTNIHDIGAGQARFQQAPRLLEEWIGIMAQEMSLHRQPELLD